MEKKPSRDGFFRILCHVAKPVSIHNINFEKNHQTIYRNF